MPLAMTGNWSTPWRTVVLCQRSRGILPTSRRVMSPTRRPSSSTAKHLWAVLRRQTSTKSCKLIPRLTATQPRDITSDTRIPRTAPAVVLAWVLLDLAASSRNQPINAIHRPPKPAPEKYFRIPSRMNRKAATWPTHAATRVERLAFLVTTHRIERSTLPPSRGNAGIMLKSARLMLIYPSQTRIPVTAVCGSVERCQTKPTAIPRQLKPIIRLAIGPAIATQNSVFASVASPWIWETPPSANRVILLTLRLRFWATSEWASSCNSKLTKNSTAVNSAVIHVSPLPQLGFTCLKRSTSENTIKAAMMNQL